MNTLFKNIILNGTATDLFIEDGILSDIPNNSNEYDIVDCSGCTALPSFTDLHVHLRDPGLTHKETVETGTLAARNGGFSSIFSMPNTKPVCDNPETIKYIIEKEKFTEVFPVAAITQNLSGTVLNDFYKLKEAGAVAVSDDGMPVEDTELFIKALKEAKKLDLPVFAHCENKADVKDRLNIPHEAESTAVKREIQAASKAETPIHICHVSTKESLAIIREAKAAGISVTAETGPHYFTLTKDAIKTKGSYAMMNPPLCQETDVEAVKEAISDGTIDIISTDHAPHSAEEKEGPLEKAPFGITGLETSFALSYTHLVKSGVVSFEKLIEMMCIKPRLIGKIPNLTFLEKGKKPTFIIVDLNKEFQFSSSKSLSKSRNTPFDGSIMTGEIKYNILRGDMFKCQQMYL